MQVNKQKLLGVGLVVGLSLSSVFSPNVAVALSTAQSASAVTSNAGYDQYETAAKIAQNGWSETSDYAILAAGMPANLVDALAAGPLAAKLNAPIVLTEGNILNHNAKEQLTRLKVKKVFITSGSAVIKQSVIDEVKTIATVVEVKALGGFDASETSVNIAKEMANQGVKVENAVVAGGVGSDALSVATIAAAQGMPILYTKGSTLSNYVSAYLESIKADVKQTYVIGGTAVISEDVKAQIPGVVKRYAGVTRYDTNIEVLKNFAGAKNKMTYVANGQSMVDALAGVPLAVKTNSLVLLTDQTLPEASKQYAQANLSSNVIGLGGTAAVPTSVLTSLAPAEIISVDGSSKGSDDAAKLEQLNGILKVTGKDVTVKNAKTDYSVYIQGDKVVLDNLTVNGTIFLDPGDNGTSTLKNVTATNIVILSGADHSINLINVKAQLLDNQSSSSNVHINATEGTQIVRTVSSASASFQADNGTSFGIIKVFYSPQSPGWAPVVKFSGYISPDTIEAGTGVQVSVGSGGGGGGGGGVVTTDKTALSTAITNAKTLLLNTPIGRGYQNVSQAAHDTFSAAITAAEAVRDAANSSQALIDAQKDTLTAATNTFNGAVSTQAEINTQGDADAISGVDAAHIKTINYPIWVTGNVTIKNASSVYDIKLDPGENGTVNLQNVTAKNIIVLSGGAHTINLQNVIAELLRNRSTSSNTHINAVGGTITSTLSEASATFQSDDGSFGTIRITNSDQSPNAVPTVVLSGTFTDAIEVGGGVAITSAPGAAISALLIVPEVPDQTVTLNGTFDSVVVNSQESPNVTVASGTISSLVTNTSASIVLGNATITQAVTNAPTDIYIPPTASISSAIGGSTPPTTSGGGNVNSVPTPIVNKVALTAAIDAATTHMNSKTVGTAVGNVTQASRDAFQAAIDTAKAVKNNAAASQTKVDAQVAALASATTAFDNAVITAEPTNYSNLTTALDAAKVLINSKQVGTAIGNVTQAARNAFQAAITAATAVVNDTSATQAQVEAQVTALATAKNAFNSAVITTAPVNKTLLTTAIINAKTLLRSKVVGAKDGNVSLAAYNAFQAAINNAVIVQTNPNANQNDVTNQVNALATATNNFNSAVILLKPLITSITGATFNEATNTWSISVSQLNRSTGITALKDSKLVLNIGAFGPIGDFTLQAGTPNSLLSAPLPRDLNLSQINLTTILNAIKNLQADDKQAVLNAINFVQLLELTKTSTSQDQIFQSIGFDEFYQAISAPNSGVTSEAKLKILDNMAAVIDASLTDPNAAAFKADIIAAMFPLLSSVQPPLKPEQITALLNSYGTTDLNALLNTLETDQKISIMNQINYTAVFQAVMENLSSDTRVKMFKAVNFTDLLDAAKLLAPDQKDLIYANMFELMDTIMNSDISRVDILDAMVLGANNKTALFQVLKNLEGSGSASVTITATLKDAANAANTKTYTIIINP